MCVWNLCFINLKHLAVFESEKQLILKVREEVLKEADKFDVSQNILSQNSLKTFQNYFYVFCMFLKFLKGLLFRFSVRKPNSHD